jgi:Alginate export
MMMSWNDAFRKQRLFVAAGMSDWPSNDDRMFFRDWPRRAHNRPAVCQSSGRRRLVTALRRAATFFAIACLPTASQAQVRTDADRAPTLTIERYPEDWSHLEDPARRTERWTERFKYVPLRKDGSIFLTTGVELRSRYEGYDNPNWGSSPDEGYVWNRLMPYADLHVGSVRIFAQPIVSGITGADRRRRTPVDTTGADLLQAFVEVELEVAEGTSLRGSAGRKLLSLGAGRFISTRYGPGIPQAFDGADATMAGRTRQLTAFYFRPVDTSKGDFDDRGSRQKSTWGVYATQWLGIRRSSGIDAYYLGLRDRRAVYDQGAGKQILHTFGARIFGDTGSWNWNVEAALQRGSFAGKRSSAWGVASEFGYRLKDMPLQPEFSLAADIVSGDGDPDDRVLGTFNPMFPNGKYLGALTPVGPRNLMHVRPSAAIHLHRDVQVSLTAAAFWRESTRDGVYAIPGIVLRSGSDSEARFIGRQFELAAAWQATPELNLSASASQFDPGRFIRETGPSRPIRMISTTANFRF